MAGRWREVVKLTFKGERFRDHALDLTALTELHQFQRLVAETAKALWRAANPNRERLPAHFEDRTRLCLRRIDEGSAVAPLEVYLGEAPQDDLWEPEPEEIAQAVTLAHDVFDSVERGQALPDRLPKELVTEYLEWGKTLAPGEAIEIQPTGLNRGAKVSRQTRNRLAAFMEGPHQSEIEVSGQILEADVRQRRFHLWIDDKTGVAAAFTEAQEELVTSALKEYRSIRATVRGVADMSAEGRPLQFTAIQELILSPIEPVLDTDALPVEDVLADIASRVPREQWTKLPLDLTDQLDHYLYGTPRQ